MHLMPLSEKPKPSIELVNVTELDTPDLMDAAYWLANILKDPAQRRVMKSMGRQNTLKRHANPGVSLGNLRTLQRLENQQTMVGYTAGYRPVAFGTIQEGLQLFSQKLPVPAVVARRLGFHESVAKPPDNVSGWIDIHQKSPWTNQEVLTEVYSELSKEAEGCSWTIEKGQSTFRIEAISRAGYQPQGPLQRYDELERPGVPAMSQLLVKHSD